MSSFGLVAIYTTLDISRIGLVQARASGYSLVQSLGWPKIFEKVTRRAPLAQRVILLQRKSWSALNATKHKNGGIKVIISFFPQVRFDWDQFFDHPEIIRHP